MRTALKVIAAFSVAILVGAGVGLIAVALNFDIGFFLLCVGGAISLCGLFRVFFPKSDAPKKQDATVRLPAL